MPASTAPKILALVLAGGKGTRLHPLTANESKPALPFTERHRVIDFVLSNLHNSGIRQICVLAQYKPESLLRHLAQSWKRRIEAAGGFIETLLPRAAKSSGFAGTAHAVLCARRLIEDNAPDLVAVFSADHVYRMDVRQMVEFHLATRADVSVAAVPVPLHRAASFGVVRADESARMIEFSEKPAQPKPMPNDARRAYASMGNYLFDSATLLALLEDAAARGGTDFGRHILPYLPPRCRAFVYDFSTNWIPGLQPWEERAYWRDVGTLDAYREALQDVAGAWPRFEMRKAEWPLHGVRRASAPGTGAARRARLQLLREALPR